MDEKYISKVKILLLSFAVLCIVLTAGCTGTGETSSPQQQAEQTQATVSQESSGSQVYIEAVHNSKLKEFLPTATGNWESGDAIGLQTDDGQYSWSWASKTYEQKLGGNAVVDIIIQDTATQDVGYMMAWETYMEFDTPDESIKKTTVQGYPGWIITDKVDNIITQVVNVNNRFIVYTSVSDGKEDYLTVFNTMMNLKGLAALAG